MQHGYGFLFCTLALAQLDVDYLDRMGAAPVAWTANKTLHGQQNNATSSSLTQEEATVLHENILLVAPD
jgi:hypothetical protein